MFFPSTRERKFSHMCATTNPHVIESTAAPFSTGVYSGPLNFVTEQNQRKWLFLPAVRSCQCRMDYTAIQHVHQNTHVVPPSPFRGRRPVARSRRLGPLGGKNFKDAQSLDKLMLHGRGTVRSLGAAKNSPPSSSVSRSCASRTQSCPLG